MSSTARPRSIPSGVGREAEVFRESSQQALDRVISSGQLVLGQEVRAFEKEFAQWLNVGNVVGVASGTDALTLLLKSHGIGEGDEVVIPATAVPSVCGVARCGAAVRFADVNPVTMRVTPATLSRVLTARTRAVVLVHLYGSVTDPRPIYEFLDATLGEGHGVYVFEDCAQAHGALLNGVKAGGLADGAAWSFYPTKNLSCLGDGGAVSVNDEEIAGTIMKLRQYGETKKYVSEDVGLNSRLDELQAAILRSKLPALDALVARRREVAAAYSRGLPSGWRFLDEARGETNARHLFPVFVADRDAKVRELNTMGLPVGVHYPLGAHRQPNRVAASADDQCPVTDELLDQVMTLPIHPYLSDEDVSAVLDFVHAAA